MRLPDPESSRVVLIGASRYEDNELSDLPAVGRGIEDLHAAVTDVIYGLVPETHCDVLEDEGDIRLIGRRLRQAASQAKDLLLVYFAGHGLTAGRRHELYLALRDTEWEAPEFSALEYDKLRSAVLNSPATTKMIILDCCFSGRAFADTMTDPASELIGQVEVDGSYVLASAHRNAVALIAAGEEHTAFTGRLLRLLHDGMPGGPELLTIDDIYHRLRAQMKAEGLPQPHSRGTDNANMLALARNRAYAALPAGGPVSLAPLPVSIRPSRHDVWRPGSVAKPIGVINDRYELNYRRTHTGHADTYAARDIMLGRVVTVKVQSSNWADEFFFARFFEEARAAAVLNDPGISAIHDFGKAELNGQTVAYIVMEYVDGQTLREILHDQSWLPPSQAVAIVDNFLIALDVVHQNGLFYQEMGLSNIMLTPTGHVKISNAFNLGFTRHYISESDDESTGVFFGTVEYIAPERIRGGKVDARSDIYLTGCMLYELLTGKTVFEKDLDAAIIWAHLEEEPSAPSATIPEIPSWCDRIVLRALEKNPDLRFRDATEMRRDINSAISPRPALWVNWPSEYVATSNGFTKFALHCSDQVSHPNHHWHG